MKNPLIKSWIERAAHTDRPVFLPVILGTNRKGRLSAAPARYVFDLLQKRPDATTELVDVSKFNFPQDDYGTSTKTFFPDYVDTVKRADGFIIVAPEYNHGYPGTLKTLLDMLLPEYNHKAAGIVSVSSHAWGGVRMTENLTPVLKELGLVVSSVSAMFPNAGTAFLDSGEPTDQKAPDRVNRFLDEMVWLAKTLRWGRGKLQ